MGMIQDITEKVDQELLKEKLKFAAEVQEDIESKIFDAKINDPVNRPAHYTQWFQEPLTFIILNNIPFAEGNVIKYVMRWRKKNGIEDLRKARRVIDMLIEMEEHRADYTPAKRCL